MMTKDHQTRLIIAFKHLAANRWGVVAGLVAEHAKDVGETEPLHELGRWLTMGALAAHMELYNSHEIPEVT